MSEIFRISGGAAKITDAYLRPDSADSRALYGFNVSLGGSPKNLDVEKMSSLMRELGFREVGRGVVPGDRGTSVIYHPVNGNYEGVKKVDVWLTREAVVASDAVAEDSSEPEVVDSLNVEIHPHSRIQEKKLHAHAQRIVPSLLLHVTRKQNYRGRTTKA
jgi:hypothetical protein